MRSIAIFLLILGGCDRADTAKLNDAKYRATMESRGIGRFQIIPASGQFPPLYLDTVTGCVAQFHLNSNTGALQKLPVDPGDHACLGDMPRDTERQVMEASKK